MSVVKSVFCFLLLAICAAFPVVSFAQASNTGVVAGVIVGPDGSPVAGATVALSAFDAPVHTANSADDGSFLLRDLASGGYTIKTTAASFAPDEETVSVAVGRTTHLSIRLSIASTQQNVNVTAAPVTFDTSQTSSVVNIDRDRVEELPIPSRNYLTFVLLSPQVAAANPALQQQGATPSGGSFSFGGLRPGSNAIYLDGVNDNDEYIGGSRTQLSPEAISDFQIVNHGFAAQSGGGAGGSIDVQTRTGVNRIHGDAFTFVQNGALNGTPPLGLYSYKPDESRVRAGVALGGPIQRDKTFYYVAAEQEMARSEDTNDLNPATLSTINSSIQRYAPLSGLTLQSGFFPTTDQETELSGRIDHSLTAHESIMLRYAFTNSRNVNDAFHTDELTDRTTRGSSFLADNSLNGTLTSATSESLLNKFSFELAQRRAVQRTGQITGPGILIAGTALFGTPYSGNERRFETHTEFADTIALQLHQHFIQFGGRADHVALRTRVSDGSQGLFVFGNLAALQNGNPDFFTHHLATLIPIWVRFVLPGLFRIIGQPRRHSHSTTDFVTNTTGCLRRFRRILSISVLGSALPGLHLKTRSYAAALASSMTVLSLRPSTASPSSMEHTPPRRYWKTPTPPVFTGVEAFLLLRLPVSRQVYGQHSPAFAILIAKSRL